ncbi:hypothetical protein GFL96_20025 [Rhizobium leguminosarum bv. viciae]|nr:hypothetical protein [Rhizobium leguminosarum bv. viciae]
MIKTIEAMHLLPQSFDFQTAHSSSQGTSVGTAALLLPVAVRFSESLPHLLPRQAFSFPEQSLLQIEIEWNSHVASPTQSHPSSFGTGWRFPGGACRRPSDSVVLKGSPFAKGLGPALARFPHSS